MQCLVEAGAVGMAGGIVGLALAWLGLWAVRQQPASYAELAHLDPLMLLTTFLLAVGASLLAGLIPAWKAMQVTPAILLKSQRSDEQRVGKEVASTGVIWVRG